MKSHLAPRVRPGVIALATIAFMTPRLQAADCVSWRFDEGRGHRCETRTADGPPAFTSARWATGPFGTAVYTSARKQATVRIPDSPAVQFGTGGFSISCWLYPTQLELDDRYEQRRRQRRVLFKNNAPDSFWVLDIREEGKLIFVMRDDNGNTSGAHSTGAIPAGRWSHVAIAVDRDASRVRFYIDGRLDSERAIAPQLRGSVSIPGKDIHISTSARKYIGLIDDLRLCRSALSEAEISKAFQSAVARHASDGYELKPISKPTFSLPPPQADRQSMWDTDSLYRVPQTYTVTDLALKNDSATIQSLFYEGESYRNQPTRVFAWYGWPEQTDEPVPAMVLVHGGGGTAFKSWVETWIDRGYAAIAMDTCGGIPIREENAKKKWRRHDHSGPNGWGDFENVAAPVTDQWTYHAVAAVIRAHSLLRSFPEVDAGRIGVTGISWGGYLTNIVAGVDHRFRFAAPVYGCGFLGENSSWLPKLRRMGKAQAMQWLRLWDPSRYVVYADMPMLFCNGTNDKHYRLDSWRKTYRAAPGPRTLVCRLRMRHAHPPAGDPPEITAFADARFTDGAPLPTITGQGRDGHQAWITFHSDVPVVKARLLYTEDDHPWHKRHWKTAAGVLDVDAGRVTGQIPDSATAYFINITDDRGLIVSSEHAVLN